MLTFETTLEPRYFKQFVCIGSACEDSCCTGWDVNIDKATYDKYQKIEHDELKPMIEKYVTPQNQSDSDDLSNIAYAKMAMGTNCSCPFFAADGLCTIQKTLGEEALSITCDTYPRTYKNVNSVLERSLSVSCPSAAELILLNKEPMQFDRIETAVPVKNNYIASLHANLDINDKPYRYFDEVRSFIVTLLQNRTYPLWQRLVILSLFCDRMDQVSSQFYDEDVPYLLQLFTNKIDSGEFREPMNHTESQSDVQLQIMNILLNHRLQGSFVNDRFLSSIHTFKLGIGDEGDASQEAQEAINERYNEAYRLYYQPFMEKHEYILENYVVNYAFKNLFPFGPQTSAYQEKQSVYAEYVQLIVNYSLIKTLLIGVAGHHKDNLKIEHVTTTIQVFSKSIEHNLPFVKQAVQFIETCNMKNTGGMTVLIKN